MTREQAKKNLIKIGIAEPTDEQVSDYLNSLNGDIKSYKDQIEQYKEKAEKSDELQAQIDAINNEKLTDVEKANAETKKANEQIEKLQQQLTEMTLAKNLSDQGISGDEAKAIIESIGKGDFSTVISSFGKIISDAKVAAGNAKEQELLNGTPGGTGGAGSNDNKLSTAEQLATSLFGGSNGEGQNDVLSHYLQ